MLLELFFIIDVLIVESLIQFFVFINDVDFFDDQLPYNFLFALQLCS